MWKKAQRASQALLRLTDGPQQSVILKRFKHSAASVPLLPAVWLPLLRGAVDGQYSKIEPAAEHFMHSD